MKNKSFKIDKLLKLSIIIVSLFVGVSFFYYFLIKPFSKDRSLKKCLQKAQNQYDIENKNMIEGLNIVYRERGPKEVEIKELKSRKSQLDDLLEKEIKSPEMKDVFEKIKLNQLKSNNCYNPITLWDKVNCNIYDFDLEAIKEYKNRNEKYKKTIDQINILQAEIRDLNKKDSQLNSNELKEGTDKNLKEAQDFCFRLY